MQTDSSLYNRLGGYDVIAAFVDNLLEMLKQDPRFSRFGMGRSLDSHRRVRQLNVDLICHRAGGPSFYTGRDMKTSHAGLAITETEWEIGIDCARLALRKLGVGERETNEVIALLEHYTGDIVESSIKASEPAA
ncbi:MAG: group 1 truncated hemoglobin [Acidobacteriaceae bacterium]|nr:group 1 truncated hemoglobin [Acidobacteriaceae bacterium]